MRRTLCLIVLLALALPVAAADIIEIRIQQMDFLWQEPAEPVIDSGMGTLAVSFNAGPITQYLNVVAMVPGVSTEPAWIVRNLLLHDLTVGNPYEEDSAAFPWADLDVPSGDTVAAVEYGYLVTDQPLLDEEYPGWTSGAPLVFMQPVEDLVVATGSFQPGWELEGPYDPSPSPWYPGYGVPGDDTIANLIACMMSNVELDSLSNRLDWNGCVPAACANSMNWLREQHPEIDFPGDLRSIFQEMSGAMGRTKQEGVWPKDTVRGKLDFIEAHNLPVHVKYQGRFSQGDVSSTAGHSTGHDMGGANSYPTAAWLKSEAAAGEDVEVNVDWFYRDSDGKTKSAGAHCMVLAGAGRSAGADWVKLKDDLYQGAPGGARQVTSGITTKAWDNGAMVLPGLNRQVKRTDGVEVTAEAVVTSVISESFDSGVTGPPGGESTGGWCTFIKRTIPPGGGFEVTFPNASSSQSSTLWVLDRKTDPPTLRQHGGWALNSGRERAWKNNEDYPVTVMLHNDDWFSGLDPQDVQVHVAPVVTGGDPTDPDDYIVYAGRSCGSSDGSNWELAPNDLGPFVSAGPIGPGFDLSTVPQRLAVTGWTQQLHLFMEMSPNPYWEDMGLVVDVLDVAGAGDILIDCPSTGYQGVLPVVGPGRHVVALGAAGGGPFFEIYLTAANGLDIGLDCLGVPTFVDLITGVDDLPLVRTPALEAHPNPFNPGLTLSFVLERAVTVELRILDLRGRLVAVLLDERVEAGERSVAWRPEGLAAGTYLAQLRAGGRSTTRTVTLVK